MDNKVIWITGASSGIGKSLAIKFAKEGWKVAISARRKSLLDEISKINENIHVFGPHCSCFWTSIFTCVGLPPQWLPPQRRSFPPLGRLLGSLG